MNHHHQNFHERRQLRDITIPKAWGHEVSGRGVAAVASARRPGKRRVSMHRLTWNWSRRQRRGERRGVGLQAIRASLALPALVHCRSIVAFYCLLFNDRRRFKTRLKIYIKKMFPSMFRHFRVRETGAALTRRCRNSAPADFMSATSVLVYGDAGGFARGVKGAMPHVILRAMPWARPRASPRA